MSIALPPVHARPLRDAARRPYALDDIVVNVKSFLRFECLRRFLDSVRCWYPSLPIVVVDDSLKPGERYGPEAEACRRHPSVVRWVQLPWDSGLSAGRNAGVEACAELGAPLTLICDDDYVFTQESDLAALLDVLHESGADLAAGVLRWEGEAVKNWGGLFDAAGIVRPTDTPWQQTPAGHWYREAHCVLNLFVAETQTLQRVRWDERLKIHGEHIDWMYSTWRAGLRNVYTPSCVTLNLPRHRTHTNAEYRALRTRWREHEEYYEQKHGRPYQSIPIVPEDRRGPFRELAPATAAAANMVLLTVGHTGSSVTAELMQLLGWGVPENDPEYHEPAATRAINDRIIRGVAVPAAELERHLAGLPRPWVLKDPRWCHTLDRWLPALAPYRPRLLYLERDRDRIIRSFQRRGEPAHGNADEFVDWRLQQAERLYTAWPWDKQRVRFEELVRWAATIDPQRL